MNDTVVFSPAAHELELDPLLWKELPQDLLKMVISKLPFSRAVEFRTICQLWNSDVIPSAARSPRKATLLYFEVGSAQWLQLCNSSSLGDSSLQNFQPTSFPVAERGESVRLMSCEGGLLFFAFIDQKGLLMRIVACNPLTAKSRSLSLPWPLKCYIHNEHDIDLLVGVTLDRETENYHLLVAGRDESTEYATFLFKSSTSTWVNGPSLDFALAEIDGVRFVYHNSIYTAGRSVVGPDGNLYWNALINNFRLGDTTEQVIKFDVQQETWRIIPLDVGLQCHDDSGYWQIANHEGAISVWHLHEHEGNGAMNHFENHASSSAAVLFDPNYVRYPRQVERQCQNDLELGLNLALKWMNHNEIVAVEELLAMQAHFDEDCRQYFAFSNESVTYHVMRVFSSLDQKMYLKAIAHDTAENSFYELEGCSETHFLCPSSVWAYAASLTALP